MVALTVSSEYAYVLLVALTSGLSVFGLSEMVSFTRKAADVPYPYMYAEKSEAEKNHKKNIFNCTQRAHQNTLEILPIFNILLLIGGLKYPKISAISGLVFILGRIIYVSGYVTGDPSKRMRGIFGLFGLVPLLGTSLVTVFSLLKN